MFGNGNSLRHLPFFEEVATYEEHQAEWRAATAGLVTLRLVDSWIEEGVDAVGPDSWNLRAVLKAIDAMDEGSPVPSILRSVVTSIQESPADARAAAPRLVAYGRALELDGKWRLALDVYDSMLRHPSLVGEPDTTVLVQLQRAVSLRTLGRYDEALDAYANAGSIAEQAGDMMGVLRAKIGDAIVAMARGNLPYADQTFEYVAEQAGRFGYSESRAMALDGRAAVAGFRGDHELAIHYAYDALQTSPSAIERDRILHNIGTAFQLLGIRSAARDAFLVLSATAQEQYTRWSALLTLMSIAAEDGAEPAFEQYRRSLATATMPPDLETDYFIHLGRSYRQLGHEDMAQIAFAKAIELAEHHQLNRHLFEAETAMRTPRPTTPAPDPGQLSAVSNVASAMRTMREQVGVPA